MKRFFHSLGIENFSVVLFSLTLPVIKVLFRGLDLKGRRIVLEVFQNLFTLGVSKENTCIGKHITRSLQESL